MSNARSDVERVRISANVGGSLALEFANTAGWHFSSQPIERLTRWRDFARWAGEQGLLDTETVAALAARDIPLEPVIALREALFRAGVAVARHQPPEAADLSTIVAAASAGLPRTTWRDGRLRWQIDLDSAPTQLLGLIARRGLDLFASDRASRLSVCQASDCGWLFLDDSRGRPRRWCSMSDCGNRAKARSAYARSKAARQESLPVRGRTTRGT